MTPTDAQLNSRRAKHPPLRPISSAPVAPTTSIDDPREFVRFLHDEIKLSDREIARATGGAHEVTVRRWRSKSPTNITRYADSLDDLRAIVGLLLNSVLYPEEVGRFLRSRNDKLEYDRPLDYLGRRQFDQVLEAAEQLVEDMRAVPDIAADITASADEEHVFPVGD